MIASIVLTLFAGAGIWFLLRRAKDTRHHESSRGLIDEIEDDIRRERKEHHAALSAALSACQETHPSAVGALSWLAASDGTVSKQELRVIFRFCEEQGTPIAKAAYRAIDSLNAGMSMEVKATENDALNSISKLTDKPPAYKLAFYGATNKLCGSQKKLSQAKQRFLKSAEALMLAGG